MPRFTGQNLSKSEISLRSKTSKITAGQVIAPLAAFDFTVDDREAIGIMTQLESLKTSGHIAYQLVVDEGIVGPTFESLISAFGSAIKLWWKLNDQVGSTTFSDSSGNNNPGTPSVLSSFSLQLPSLVGEGACVGTAQSTARSIDAGIVPELSFDTYTLLYVTSPQFGNATTRNLVGHQLWVAVGVEGAGANPGAVTLWNSGGLVTTSNPGVVEAGRSSLIELSGSYDGQDHATVYVDGIERIPAYIPTSQSYGYWGDVGFSVGDAMGVFITRGRFQHVVILNRQLTVSERANLNLAFQRH